MLLESGERVSMAQLRVGDRIAALDPATGVLVFSEVLLFLDRDPERQRRFVTLTTASGARLSLTPTHLIHVSEAGGCQEADCFRPAYAGSVEVGQRVLVADGDNFRVEEVTAVGTDSYRGVYAPLTATGTLVVDNLAASCYAVIDSQSVAHAAFAPLRLWSNLRSSLRHLFSWSSSGGGSSVPRTIDGVSEGAVNARTGGEGDGVHWYADFLYSVARWLVPSHMVL